MRLIDADALGVGRCSRDLLPAAYCAGWNGLVNLIEEAPTIDAVPVTRCKDCKRTERLYGVSLWCTISDTRVKENDFCSYGERRSE